MEEGKKPRSEGEAKYRLLFEQSRDAITIVSSDGHFIDANKSFLDMMGYCRAEIMAMPASALWLTPQDRQSWQEALAQHGSVMDYPSRQKTRDGRVLDLLISSSSRQCLDGQVVYQSILRDITAQMIAEAEKEALIQDLRQALAEVKTLRGLIPICSHCKNIRDDSGYWRRIEDYLECTAEAQLTHGICPECAVKFYPDLDIY